MKLDWYTLCWNEEDIIPYVIDYWKKLITDGIDLHVYVYDNHSTDRSVEMLSKYDWIEVRTFESDGMNDVIQATIKNSCWIESKGRADFCCVSDIDEVLWGDLKEELEHMKQNGYNMLGTQWYAFCGDRMPTYTEGKYLHQLVKKGYSQYVNHMEKYKFLGKFMVFDPNLQSIRWSVGNHILFDIQPEMKLYISDSVTAFHINKGFSMEYFIKRRQLMFKRLSQTNLKYGMCIEYGHSVKEMENEYKGYQAKSVDISGF